MLNFFVINLRYIRSDPKCFLGVNLSTQSPGVPNQRVAIKMAILTREISPYITDSEIGSK